MVCWVGRLRNLASEALKDSSGTFTTWWECSSLPKGRSKRWFRKPADSPANFERMRRSISVNQRSSAVETTLPILFRPLARPELDQEMDSFEVQQSGLGFKFKGG